MKVVKGKVVSGKVVIEDESLEEGAVVAVISSEDGGETFRLGPEEEQEILTSVAEAERGETISGEEILDGLDSRD